MKHALALLGSALLTISAAGFSNPAQAEHDIDDPIFVCNETVNHATIEGNVFVPLGGTCIIRNSTIEGNVRTLGAKVVVLRNTDVQHNVHLRHVTRRVTIGPRGCRVDPEVGNNLKVRHSNNVAICQTAIGNNLVLRNNTGRLMARGNLACNNIRIVRNDLVDLRVVRNDYVVNFVLANNSWTGTRLVKNNDAWPGTPGECKREVKDGLGD